MPNNNNNGISNTDRILIALTALALNCPSTFTIAWSKEQHKEEMPILYLGIATSAATVTGAILGDKYHGDKIMWAGLIGTLALFGYVAFIYHPKNGANGNTTMIKNTQSVVQECRELPQILMV